MLVNVSKPVRDSSLLEERRLETRLEKSLDESASAAAAVRSAHIALGLQCHFQGVITQVVLISMRGNYSRLSAPQMENLTALD